MPEFGIAVIALAMVALKGAFPLLVVYIGARWRFATNAAC